MVNEIEAGILGQTNLSRLQTCNGEYFFGSNFWISSRYNSYPAILLLYVSCWPVWKEDATLAMLIGGLLLSGGALLWYKFVVPFDRMLKQSEENERRECVPPAESIIQTPELSAADASLVNLSNALGRPRVAPAARVPAVHEEEKPSTRAVAPVA